MVKAGLSIIFITHKLQEVIEASTRVTVLRGGKVVGTVMTVTDNRNRTCKIDDRKDANTQYKSSTR